MAARKEKMDKPVRYALYKGKIMPRAEVLERELEASEAKAPDLKPSKKVKVEAKAKAKAKSKKSSDDEAAELAKLQAELDELEAQEADASAFKANA